MKDTLNEWIAEVPERERVFAQEQLIVSVAENIWEKMETQGVTKADIAKTLGKSKAFITQCLNGGRNMTLRTLSDIAFALHAKVTVELRAKDTALAYGSTLSFVTPNVSSAVPNWNDAKTTKLVTDVIAETSLTHKAADSADKIAEDLTFVYGRAA